MSDGIPDYFERISSHPLCHHSFNPTPVAHASQTPRDSQYSIGALILTTTLATKTKKPSIEGSKTFIGGPDGTRTRDLPRDRRTF